MKKLRYLKTISGGTKSLGTFTFSGALTLNAAATIVGAVGITGAVTITGAVGIDGVLTMATTDKIVLGTATTFIHASATNTLALGGTNITITGIVGVTGAVTLTGTVIIAAANTFASGTGTVSLNGNVTVATAKTINVTDDSGLKIAGTAIAATAAEINRSSDVSARIIDLTAATLSLTEATHDGAIITINKADGSALTLPAATGSGVRIRLFIGTTITSVGTTIKVADATDIMYGAIVGAIDGGTTNNFWLTAADSDTITFNGTTTGGYIGDQIELIDVATNAWLVNGWLKQTGTEATPFSATVA